MTVAAEHRYIRGRRCPICGGADGDARGAGRRCFGFLSADGLYAHCSRDEMAGPIEKSAHSDTYGHRLAGSCKCGHAHAMPLEKRAPRAVDIGQVVAEYNYHDESGVLLYQVVRYGPVKKFRQRRPDGAGGWIWKLDPEDGPRLRRVLYRLDRVLKADPEVIIWQCEGEKDVHAMESLGFVATCNPGGAGKWHLVADCAKKALKGRHVVVIADGDDKGRDHAADVAKRLQGIAASVRVIDPVRGHDAASWIEQGGTAQEFLAAATAPSPPIVAIATSNKPRIEIGTDRKRVIDQAQDALRAYGGIYVRGRSLVHAVSDDAPECLQMPKDATFIGELGDFRLTEMMSTSADWRKLDNRKRPPDWVPAHPPDWAAKTLRQRQTWPFPKLDGISTMPVVCHDGSLHDQPGYDARSRMIYEPDGAVWPRIPEPPTRAQAVAAYAELVEPFCDFKWLSPSDEAATVALILSLISRPAIDGPVPAFQSESTTPGAGKGLLIDACSMIAIGREAAKMAQCDDAEMRKSLLPIAIASPPLVLIDNIEGAFGSKSLAMALTTGVLLQRMLGLSEDRMVALRSVFCFSGNNIQLVGDLGRRVVPINQDPRMEHPEDRTGFRYDPLIPYLQSQRPRLASAALTILRAYVVAGRPPHGKPAKGSFAAWDRLVRGAVIWVSCHDPCGGVDRIREASDMDRERLRALIGAWLTAFRDQAVTTGDLLEHARMAPELHAAIEEYAIPDVEMNATRLGQTLAKVRGRIVGDRSIEHAGGTAHGGARRWVVRGPE